MRSLRDMLTPHLDPDPPVPRGGDPAAVLIPILEAGDPLIVFTQRTDSLRHHRGEVSFPGGRRHPEDATLRDTALRETEEELGLPGVSVEVLGAMPPVLTHVSNFAVVPFVGLLPEWNEFTPSDAEIAEVLEVPISTLLRVEREQPIVWEADGQTYLAHTYDTGSHVIWGATGRMLKGFLDLLRKEGWSVERTEPYAPEDAELRALLGSWKTIAVVGASSDPDRPSHGVMRYLQSHGYRVIPVNPNETEVLGERAYPSLRDVPEPIDVVDVFRRAESTPDIAREAVEVGAKAFWLQEGIVNDEAARIAEAGGLDVVMGLCIRTTKRRLDHEEAIGR